MSTLFILAYYLVPPAVASLTALSAAKKFDDWRIGLISGSFAGTIFTLIVALLYWEDKDVCSVCNQGVG